MNKLIKSAFRFMVVENSQAHLMHSKIWPIWSVCKGELQLDKNMNIIFFLSTGQVISKRFPTDVCTLSPSDLTESFADPRKPCRPNQSSEKQSTSVKSYRCEFSQQDQKSWCFPQAKEKLFSVSQRLMLCIPNCSLSRYVSTFEYSTTYLGQLVSRTDK